MRAFQCIPGRHPFNTLHARSPICTRPRQRRRGRRWRRRRRAWAACALALPPRPAAAEAHCESLPLLIVRYFREVSTLLRLSLHIRKPDEISAHGWPHAHVVAAMVGAVSATVQELSYLGVLHSDWHVYYLLLLRCLPGYNSHFDWLDDFFANCSGCQVPSSMHNMAPHRPPGIGFQRQAPPARQP